MKKFISTIFLSGSISLFSLSAQNKVWTLRDCIDYARRENIQVKKSQLSVESADIDILQSKAELFPSLSAGISQSFSNSKDQANNYKYESSFSGQYSLNASWTIYNGGKNSNALKQAKVSKEMETLNTETKQNDIEISITQTYLQLLYARESIKNNENIVASAKAQLDQAQIFLDAGSVTRSEYMQIESQYSSDKYNLVLAQNSFDNYKLQLKQLLELNITDEFEVDFPEINTDNILSPIPDKVSIYETALSIMPEIKSSIKNIDYANLTRSSAKGGYLPTISLSGSVGTGNVYNQSTSFIKQLDHNFGQSVGLSVSIPIFDNRKNKSTVQKADIAIQTAQLDYIDAQKTLLKTIEGLHQDVVSGQSKYQAALDKLNSAELSYNLVKEQYSLGMRNTVELTTEQNNYANALQELLQAKYTALLSIKLLNFYQGKEITI